MTRKFGSSRKAGPRAPAGRKTSARSDEPRKWLVVRPPDAECLPLPDCHLPRTIGEQIIEVRRQDDLVPPAIPAHPAVHFQIVRRRTDDVGNRVDHVAPAVAVEIDGKALERRRHELRRSEGAGPGTDQTIGRNVAALQDFQRRQKLFAEIIAAAADAGERRGRAQHRAVAAHGAVIRFDAPDRGDDVAIDAISALGRGENRSVLRQQLAPARDAIVADQEIEIVPGRFVELRLGVEQIHDAQVRREPGGVVLEISSC